MKFYGLGGYNPMTNPFRFSVTLT